MAPPYLPEQNPVGVYRREIVIPEDWNDREIFLCIDAAKSGVYVYINGKEAGYSEDSKKAAEFRINKYVKPGKNSLVLKIFRWSTGSYLEAQDFWRMSGIERDVSLGDSKGVSRFLVHGVTGKTDSSFRGHTDSHFLSGSLHNTQYIPGTEYSAYRHSFSFACYYE